MMKKSKDQGFTLVELMIVIAIIGILAAIAIPNFLSYQKKSYDAAAKTEAKNFYSMALAYFGEVGTGVTLDETDLPRGFTKNGQVTYGGSLTYNDDGTTTGSMTFSHTKSATTFTLDDAGTVQ
ncbi:type IV pilus assembly protein PilA [Candidatus Magnetomoraceae bacterium gMMP-1]